MAAVLAALLPLPAAAATSEVRYLCDDGTEIAAIYLTDRAPGLVVLTGDGLMAALEAVPAASGARYEGVPGKSGYVWWSRGAAATLYWVDAETGIEEPFVEDCARAGPG